MAVDQMCHLLSNETDEQLFKIAPHNLHMVSRKEHEKAKGF